MEDVFEWRQGDFFITTDKATLQLDRIHRFLSTKAYWCLQIPKGLVEKAIKGSVCMGLYYLGESAAQQVGFARVVTDYSTFAWICDLYIEEDYRGKGLSKWLMDCLMKHPDMAGLRRICLATKDAQELYSKYGFEVMKTPGSWMEIKDNEIYTKPRAVI